MGDFKKGVDYEEVPLSFVSFSFVNLGLSENCYSSKLSLNFF